MMAPADKKAFYSANLTDKRTVEILIDHIIPIAIEEAGQDIEIIQTCDYEHDAELIARCEANVARIKARVQEVRESAEKK